MNKKSKIHLKQSDILFTVMVCGLCLYYRETVFRKTDELFLSLLGKNLSGRNLLIQIVFWGGSFLFCILFPLLLRRLIGKIPRLRYAADALTLMLLAIPMGQLLIICANQVLRRDDYWEIADARAYGFPKSILTEFTQSDGRYTSWALKSLHAILPNVPYIDIFLSLNFVLLIVGTSLLAYRLLKLQAACQGDQDILLTQSFLLGSGLGIAFILLSSNIWEFWFWGAGAMIYGFGISLCILCAALALRLSDEKDGKLTKMIPAVITCFLTCGCSELCTASLAAFLLMMLVWKRIENKKWNRQILILLAEIFLLCICVFLLSGTLGRAGEHTAADSIGLRGAGTDLISRLPDIISLVFRNIFGFTFIKSRELTILLLIMVLFGTQLRFDKKTGMRLLILAVFLAVTAHCVLLINAFLNYIPPRVVTVGICWFFTAMALICLLIGSMIWREKSPSANRITMIFCALFLALSMNVFYRSNIDSVRDIRISWFVRDSLLRQHIGSEEPVQTCSLPCPGSFREDILKDPEDEFNRAAALYYQIPSIAAEVRCPPYGDIYLPRDLWAGKSDPAPSQ